MKKKLLKLLNAKTQRKQELVKKSDTCEDVAELRRINEEINAINEEMRELQEAIDEADDDADPDGRTAAVNSHVTTVPPIIAAQASAQAAAAAESRSASRTSDPYATPEYRAAFMDFCIHGTAIPPELRADAQTTKTDASAVIPTTILNEIIKDLKVRGQLFNRVRKTNIQGGVQVPILSLKPVAKWITEAAPSDRQKVTANSNISFSYFGLECKVAVSLLASVTALPMFEAEIVPLITEAILTALETGIIKGTGSGQMLGVTADSRVLAAQKISLAPADITKWESWKKKIFAKIPLSYRNGSFIMGAGTFDGYIDGMVDTTGQPIGRVNYGIDGGTTYRFGGKEVIEVEEDIIPGYDNAADGDIIGIYMNLADYCINSNMQLRMTRWFDEDKNQWVDKAILICDGKLIDAAGVIIITKGAGS